MHPHMALSIEECIDKTHLKNKITPIIPTSNSSIELLLWSCFSLLLRSKPNGIMEHFCVNINGPDERTGKPELQDKKQKFLEELRDADWFHVSNPTNRRQMPLTVIRAWSRVGYAEAFEMALGWIHTDSYLLMHDDVIVINPQWCEELNEKFYANPKVSLAYVPPLLGCNCDHAIHKGMYLLRLPQIETTFIAVKKRWAMQAGVSWSGYHIPSDDNFLQFEVNELPDLDEFINYYKNKGLMPETIQMTELYNFVRQEVGSWMYYKLCQNTEFAELSENNIIHFKQMSNPGIPEEEKAARIEAHKNEIEKLENEIAAHPVYSKIYEKYMPGGYRYA